MPCGIWALCCGIYFGCTIWLLEFDVLLRLQAIVAKHPDLKAFSVQVRLPFRSKKINVIQKDDVIFSGGGGRT